MIKKCERTKLTVEVCGGYCEVESCKEACVKRIKKPEDLQAFMHAVDKEYQ